MKALIFAAGLGTRLYPLTKHKPKALVQLNGKPMLEHVITRLQIFGIQDFVINVHHFADKIIDFLSAHQNFGANIRISDERDELLETGGGLLKARKLLEDSEDFIIHNADILTDIDFGKLIAAHQKSQALATLCVQNRASSRKFAFDKNGQVCGWKNMQTGEEIISRKLNYKPDYMAFTGVHVVNSRIFDLIKQSGKFSITPEYLRLAKSQVIKAHNTDANYWFDVGKIENLKKAESFLTGNMT